MSERLNRIVQTHALPAHIVKFLQDNDMFANTIMFGVLPVFHAPYAMFDLVEGKVMV